MTEQQRQMVDLWNSIEETEPEISTEQLIHRVAEHFPGKDDTDVVEALINSGEWKEV